MSLMNPGIASGLKGLNFASFGKNAGANYAKAMGASAKAGMAGMGTSLVAPLKAAADAAAAAVTAAEGKVAAAHNAAATASGRVRVAELQLNEMRAKGTASAAQLAAAEERLAVAQRTQDITATKAAGAETALAGAQTRAAEAGTAAAASTKKSAAAMAGMTSATSGTIAMMGKLGLAITAFGLFEIGKQSVEAASKFQASMNLLVTAGGESASALGLVGNGVQTIALKTGVATDQLAAGMYTLEKANLRGANGLRVLSVAAEASKAEETDLATMTNALTSVMASYHLTAGQSASVTNQLVAASGAAKTTMENFAGSLSTVLPVASAAKLSFAEVGGAIATLTSHGTSADESTQELANTIRNLAAPNGVAIKMMAEFGISSTQVSQQLGKRGLTGTLEYISSTILHKMGPSGLILMNAFSQSKIAAQDANIMLGKLSPSVQKVAKSYASGGVTLKEWRLALRAMPADQAALAQQWAIGENRAKGFNAQLRASNPSMMTYQAALQKMLGGSTGLNTALMLTGESMPGFVARVDEISRAGKKNGTDITTWAITQQNMKTQVDRMGQSFVVAGQKLGTQMLPSLTEFARELTGAVIAVMNFASANKAWLIPLTQFLLTFAAAWGALKLAVLAYNAIMAIATFWTTGFAAAWAANPVGIVIIIIAAVVAAVIYAYNHFAWFKTAVDATWHGITVAAIWAWNNVLKPTFDAIVVAVKWVGAAAVWLWQNALVPAWNGIVTAVKWLGAAFAWLWTNIIKPVFDAISFGARLLFAIVATILIVPLVLLFNLLKPAFQAVGVVAVWLWQNVFVPAFKGIGGLAVWLWTYAIKPAIDFIVGYFKFLGGIAVWLWQNVITPVFNGISFVINWAWNNVIKPAFNSFMSVTRFLGGVFVWLWHTIIEPVWNGISTAIGWVWKNGIKPVFDGIKAALTLVGNAFDQAGTFIGKVWGKVKEAVAVPIRWVVDAVYNNGIRPVFNTVAGYVGLGKDPLKVAKLGFATGGILPGYTPGRDVHLAALSGGEAVMRPEWTRAVGPDFVHAMNATARKGGAPAVQKAMGLPGFANGGIVGDIWDGAKKAATGAMGVLAKGGDILSQAAENGFGGVAKSVLGPIETGLKAVMAKGGFGASAAGLPVKIIDGIIKKFTAYDSQAGAIGGSDTGNRALNAAKSQLGVPYVFGAESPGHAFDCSGLTQWAYKQAGISIPRLAHLQQNMAGNVPSNAAIPGDLVFFGHPAEHVGMWVSPNRMINAPHDGVPVQYDHFGGGYPASNIGRPYKYEPGRPGTTSSVAGGSAQRIAMSMLSQFGWDIGQYPPLNNLWTKESGWSTTSLNRSSGAYGIPQSLPASKMATAGADYMTNPATQIRWGLGYIKSRYGSPAAAWAHSQAVNWYDEGGVLPPGPSLVYNGTGKPESVLTSSQWKDIGSRTTGSDGGTFEGNLYLTSGEFLGKVRGEVRKELDSKARAVKYGSRGGVE